MEAYKSSSFPKELHKFVLNSTKMKLIVVAIFALLAVSANAMPVEGDWDVIDWSKVVPVTEMPGFWDGREIQPAFIPGDRAGRIVGGAIVTPHAHPYQAGLLMQFGGGTGLCGGSIISTRTILTAAHCPIGSSSTQVILGAHQLTALEGTQHRQTSPSSTYRIHGSYNPSNLNNDIATIQLPGTIPLNAQRSIVVLAPATAGTFAGILATVSGWGRISDASSATSAHLRSVQNNIITNAVCSSTYGGIIIGSTICMSTAGGQGTCNGDSGGPLTVPSGGARQQVGVVSFGAAAGCQLGHPAGFARVSSFRAWITTNTVG